MLGVRTRIFYVSEMGSGEDNQNIISLWREDHRDLWGKVLNMVRYGIT